jgi:hypothetical protein
VDEKGEKIARPPIGRARGLPLGRLKEKNDLFVSLKGSFLLPFRYQQQAVDA